MQRIISKLLLLLFLNMAVVIAAVAEDIFTGVESPKIIYGDPTFKGVSNAYSSDYALINNAGFNVILSDYNVQLGSL